MSAPEESPVHPVPGEKANLPDPNATLLPYIAIRRSNSSTNGGSESELSGPSDPVGMGTAGASSLHLDTMPAAPDEKGSDEFPDANGAEDSPPASHSAKNPITQPDLEAALSKVFAKFMKPLEAQTPVLDETALQSVFEKFMKPRESQTAPDAWLKVADTAWAYEKDRVERWRNEINTLLVFAGLFSAVLTAFVVQYYTVLLPASSTNFPSPPTAPRWIAALWFVALVFSLSAASVALAVNQWLNFHVTEQAGLQDADQKVRRWQLRRHALDKWQVEYIASILPFLLQVALVLFLVGIVGYLWELGFDIAVPSTVFVGALLLFLAFTSVSPALVDYSAYKSPQAWWICEACRSMEWAIYCFSLQVYHMIIICLRTRTSPPWAEKIRAFFAQHLKSALDMMEMSNWLAHEQACLDNWTIHENTLFMAIYRIADDTDVLRAMATCVRAMPIVQAIKNVTEIGQTVTTALSKRRVSRSRASGTSLPAPGNQLLSDDLDSTATALIGRMVVDTFIRTQTELSTNRHNLDPIRHILITITPAMPFADGIEVCKLLTQCLCPDDADLDGFIRRRDQGIAETIKNVTAVGKALVAVLSNHQYPLSRASDPSPPELFNLSKQGDSVGTTITSMGRMVLDMFTQTELDDDTDSDDDTQALDLDSNHRILAGLIRAMPLADGTEACMALFQHLCDEHLSTKQRRATLDIVQNIYVPIDFLAEDRTYLQHPKMQEVRTYDCAPHTELYCLRDVENWELVQTALTTVYAHRDPMSTIQITTTVLAICMLSIKNEHTLPAEPSRGAYLANMLQRFDGHLATLNRKELQDTIQHLPPAAIYRLDWVLYHRVIDWDIDDFLHMTNSENHWDDIRFTIDIERRLQWLLQCDDGKWTTPGMVQGFYVDLQAYANLTRWRLQQAGIDLSHLTGGEGSLECAPDEPQGEDDRRVDSPQVADLEPTWEAGDEQDPPEPRTDSLIRSMMQITRDIWRTFGGTAATQEPDVEMRAMDASSSEAPDPPRATDTALPATASTTLDESPQGPDAAQTESMQSLDYTDPHADDEDSAHGVTEAGTSVGKGRQDGLASTIGHADACQGGDACSSQEGSAEVGNAPQATQLPELHC